MSTYSVAEAKSGLPGLINRALAGEEVIITRHGKPVVEIRPTAVPSPAPPGAAAFYDWLKARRSTLKEGHTLTSVQLLDLIYDEPAS
jgi:prevent-host-death family protein